MDEIHIHLYAQTAARVVFCHSRFQATISLKFLLFILIILLILIIDIDHFLTFSNTTFKTDLYTIKPFFYPSLFHLFFPTFLYSLYLKYPALSSLCGKILILPDARQNLLPFNELSNPLNFFYIYLWKFVRLYFYYFNISIYY